MSALTICTECRHHRLILRNPAAPNVWYNHYCGAMEREPTIDPVTGESGFLGRNDLGRTYFTDVAYHHCRDINHGNCEYFSKKD
jgi:hypothetical protein